MTPSFGSVFTAADRDTGPETFGSSTDTLRSALRESGAVLVRGVPFDLESFERFCGLFSDGAIVHPGTVQGGRRAVTATTATVDGGVLAFPWHAELGYAPNRPDLVGFACERAPAQGDETFLSDGCAIAERLTGTARRVAALRVRYSYSRLRASWPLSFDGALSAHEVEQALQSIANGLDDGETLEWRFRRWRGSRVKIQYTTPVLSRVRWGERVAFCNHVIWQESRRRGGGVVLEDGSLLPTDAVEEFTRLADEESSAVRWREGDLLMVDNTRIMHARGAVVEPACRRILAHNCHASF
ncbi:MAG: hypothetical protein QOC77_943 [Thermoleophilaceae bacterium]|jgi:alpha-ketoglutarate-dependent taurine dioxygenase|nr:hypothetical protein [Thermoleophilaceae bacterium]MEA2470850.1 hypothetical protein [Thermoleophilaceae bacterium]